MPCITEHNISFKDTMKYKLFDYKEYIQIEENKNAGDGGFHPPPKDIFLNFLEVKFSLP